MFIKSILSICLILVISNITYLSSQDSSLKTKGLKKFSSTSEVYFSSGYEIRARAIQEFLTEAIAFYKSEFPEISNSVNILVLDKNDWTSRYIAIPYGIPFFDNDENIVIPADKFTASAELGYEDLSTDQEISEYDKFIISTLGQSYFSRNRGITFSKIWMRDLLANYFAVAFFEVNDFLWDLNPGQSDEITQRSLDAYDSLHEELPAANYYWYQARFIEMARILFNQGGFRLLTELLDHFNANGSVELADEMIAGYCKKEYQEWKAKMK